MTEENYKFDKWNTINVFQAVWCLYADVICLNYDGNIQDASLVALLAALRNCTSVRIPFSCVG